MVLHSFGMNPVVVTSWHVCCCFHHRPEPVMLLGLDALFLSTQGPVVQSIVGLTSSLRVISLTLLADLIHNILIFFAEKM